MDHLKLKIENESIIAERTALVVIDLQKGIIGRESLPYSGAQVIENAGRLVHAFNERGAFIVFVRVTTVDGKDMLRPRTDLTPRPMQFQEGWDSLVPELISGIKYYTVTKRQWGAFYGTDLDLQLRRRGIDTIVLCGISTSIGVDTTAREAYQHGYNQIFAENAMAASTIEEHEYVCKNIFPRIGCIRRYEEIVAALR